MLASFKKSIENLDNSLPIPKELLDVLSDKTDGVLEYKQIADGLCIGTPIQSEGIFNFKAKIPMDIIKKHPEIKSSRELSEYIYRTQQPLKLKPEGDCFININGSEINIKDLIKFPYSAYENNITIYELIIQPSEFPEMPPIKLKASKFTYEFDIIRKPYDSMYIRKYQLSYKNKIKLIVFINEKDEKLNVKFNFFDSEDVFEQRKICTFYNCFLNGTIKLNGHSFVKKPNVNSTPIAKWFLHFLQHLNSIQNIINVKFKAERKLTATEYILVEGIYESLINNRPIKQPMSIDCIEGVNTNQAVDVIKDFIGKPMTFSFIIKKSVNIWSATFNVYEFTLLHNIIIKTIETENNDKYKFVIDNGQENQYDSYTQYFLNKNAVKSFQSRENWIDEFIKNSKKVSVPILN